MKRRFILDTFLSVVAVLCLSSHPAQIPRPAFAGDGRELGDEPLKLAWAYRATQPPSPAFKGGLAPSRRVPRVEPIRYDYVYHPVVGNGKLYFGSSTEEAVFCLDARTGDLKWSFYANGPIRLEPTRWKDRLFFGSDDGHVYCIDATSGELAWKYRAALDKRRAIGNGRIISAWPVRTSVAIADGVAYFGAGLLPPLGTYLHAVDAESGEAVWQRKIPYSPQGQVVVDGDSLLVATGRTCPAEFRRSDGTPLAEKPNARRAQGSSFVGRAGDIVLWGPCESGLLHIRVSPEPMPNLPRGTADAVMTGRITGLKGHSMVADERVYLLRDEELIAVDRDTFRRSALPYCHASPRYSKDTQWAGRPWGIAAAGLPLKEHQALHEQLKEAASWSTANEHDLRKLLLADGRIIAGGKDVVVVLDSANGTTVWTHDVEGNALGLAIADGDLFVSTDEGQFYCFRSKIEDEPRTHTPKPALPYSDDPVLVEAATTALARADIDKGFCVVIGVCEGQLACEIAKRSDFFVVGLDPDPVNVAAARENLTKAGLYGKQVVVHQVTAEDLAYPDFFANLIASEACVRTGQMPYRANSVLRMLQPYGGTLVLGGPKEMAGLSKWRMEGLSDWTSVNGKSGATWHVAHREELAGAGEWTHMYANPAGTVSSDDRLVSADLALQWLGPPGAEDVVERHAVAMPPLFKNGKLFISGLYDTIQAIDAYNGTSLWKVKVPESTRMMLSHNAGFMAVADDVLFVAADRNCWMLDTNTGDVMHKFADTDCENDWGYVGTTGDYLLGSGQKTPADEYSGRRRREGYRFLVSTRDLRSRPAVSDNLLAYAYSTKSLKWKYQRSSVILNSTIVVGADRVYFSESGNPAVTNDPSGTAHLTDFFADGARLVALDLHTGKEAWSQPLGPLSSQPADEHEHIMFLSYSDGILLSTRTGHIDGRLGYRLEAMDAATGRTKWKQTIPSRHRIYAPLTYGKNGQQSHPSITDGRIYLLSHITDALISIDLHTGEMTQNPELFNFWIHSKTCAVPTASATGLYFRRNSCYMYDLPSERLVDLTGVTRPSCWMSIIPAGGLVLMPEASSGCTCGFALQTSVVLVPRRPNQ